MNGFTTLSPETDSSFTRYVESTRDNREKQLSTRFLWIDAHPDLKAKVRSGELQVFPEHHEGAVQVPHALVQDWIGVIFLPGATLAQVRSVMEDYGNYKNVFSPEVTESRVISHDGDRYDVFLRLYKKQIVTVVLDGNYAVRYTTHGPSRLEVTSLSSRIEEVEHPGSPDEREKPPGQRDGFLYRLNSYWRLEQAEGGVYAECEAVSLSRDVPFGLGFIRQFVARFPRESMENTLRSLAKSVEAQQARPEKVLSEMMDSH